MSQFSDIIKQAYSFVCTPIHPEGWKFITAFALGTVILSLIWNPLGCLGLILTIWCIYFFRDPARVTPSRTGLVVSPADGLVQSVSKAYLPAEIDSKSKTDDLFTGEKLTRISIFLSVFDVHVNRAPVDGKISQIIYHPGKFLNASLDKASEDNERNTVVMKVAKEKFSVAFVQIAGLIARRIVCDVEKGQDLAAGQRYGIIRFGSRVDVYLPSHIVPQVIEGQRVIGGETVLADMQSKEKTARKGEVR